MNQHFANIVFFLLWAEQHDPNMMWGGIRIRDAIDSLAVVIGCSPQELRKLI
jgi:hypothetical protein